MGRTNSPTHKAHNFTTSLFPSIPFGPTTPSSFQVHEFLETAVTKEHFLGLIDWVEAHRPVPAVTRIYCRSTTKEGPAIVVSSGQSVPVSNVDFGWGNPCLDPTIFHGVVILATSCQCLLQRGMATGLCTCTFTRDTWTS
ncbi:hypothetical protein RIF29_17881 [Crotalaria pallida]|uniref:Uncharacterized protein n=1 Tax=Crotalaria pallida TaxID=3830 RepID=A0AAN9FL93_CROPI